ncbi:MAG: exodeoxyribonuclease VII small subunit [Deltaproteobacteria bacterium]|nr:exodeoxyribonuclease VII small subunit [Deltaproteobacteria bacterium]NIS76664.1 exodeoxyribonuclease VII small subunit [Deltaproteobacteria bacterium]
MGADKKSTLSFEDAMKKLEGIVRKLEEGNDSLEKSLDLFEEGVKLTRYCNEKLDEAEKKLEVLMKRGEKVVREDIDEEEFFESGRGEETE